MTQIFKVTLLADGKPVRGYPRMYESKRGITAVKAVARQGNSYAERYKESRPDIHYPHYTVTVQVMEGEWNAVP